MIDEVVCYIESPEEIQCEINQVVIKWEGEYYPYKGEYEIWPTKEDQVLNTKQCYLDQNIIVHKAQYDPYGGKYNISPTFGTTTLETEEKYMQENLVIKIPFERKGDETSGLVYYIGNTENIITEGDNGNE